MITTLEQATDSLEQVFIHIKVLESHEWYVVDDETDNDVLSSLSAIERYLESIVSFVEPLNHYNSLYFNHIKDNVSLVISGVKSKEFLFNYSFPELISYGRFILDNSVPLAVGSSDSASEVKKHGGARVGAGAKKKNPTEQIRVDADLASLLKTLSDVYRSGSESQKCRLLELLLDIGVDEGEV